MTRPLQAIVFDFDGVIADSEPLHLRAFQQALAENGIELTPQEYFNRYLGYDDVGAFQAIGRDRGVPMDDGRVADLVARKGVILQNIMQEGSVLFPGAREFIREAASAVPIGIASGALRHEIDEIIEAAGVAELFAVIVASGDTPQSKPSPAPYQLAFERLARSAALRRHRGFAVGAAVGARRRSPLRRRHQQLSRSRIAGRRAHRRRPEGADAADARSAGRVLTCGRISSPP
jgi:beta-phosphoglucomutase-like phosphatase (HAD superfamily)